MLRDRRGWEIRPTRSRAVPGKGLERMRIKGETFPLLIIEAQSVMLISPPPHPLLLTPSHIPWPYYPYFQFRHSPLFYTWLDPQRKRGPRRMRVRFSPRSPDISSAPSSSSSFSPLQSLCARPTHLLLSPPPQVFSPHGILLRCSVTPTRKDIDSADTPRDLFTGRVPGVSRRQVHISRHKFYFYQALTLFLRFLSNAEDDRIREFVNFNKFY